MVYESAEYTACIVNFIYSHEHEEQHEIDKKRRKLFALMRRLLGRPWVLTTASFVSPAWLK